MSDNCCSYPQSIQRAMTAPSACSSIDQELDLVIVSRRQRSRRRQQFVCPSRFILLALCFAAANSCLKSQAFSSPISHPSTRIRSSSSSSCNTSNDNRHERRFYMSSLAELPAQSSSSSSKMTDFQRRMKGLIKRNGGGANGRRTAGQRAIDKPTNLRTVYTLEEYKEVLDEEHGKMVVVRFFATWCKACKAIQPAYYRMASLYPNIVFLEVPVTNQNANLHQGLDVPSLPYGHIYYPEAGLVEELKISKKYFPNLVRMVRWYDGGECGLDEFVPESDDEE